MFADNWLVRHVFDFQFLTRVALVLAEIWSGWVVVVKATILPASTSVRLHLDVDARRTHVANLSATIIAWLAITL